MRPDRTLSPEAVLAAFAHGAFPMADRADDPGVTWYVTEPRAILPLGGFHCSRTLARTIRRGLFEIRHDTAFEAVMRSCAARGASEGVWISERLIETYVELHRRGYTHSVEAWRDGHLVGGLYGLALGGAFFAESMFHRAELGGTDAGKVCVAHLVAHLKGRGFVLLDVQMTTPVTERLGVIEIPHAEFMPRLEAALLLTPEW